MHATISTAYKAECESGTVEVRTVRQGTLEERGELSTVTLCICIEPERETAISVTNQMYFALQEFLQTVEARCLRDMNADVFFALDDLHLNDFHSWGVVRDMYRNLDGGITLIHSML